MKVMILYVLFLLVTMSEVEELKAQLEQLKTKFSEEQEKSTQAVNVLKERLHLENEG